MLVRTSSGSTSVGHLSHSPHGFSSLHRPDVSFQCGGLVFPVHSLLLSVSSPFFCDFFRYVRDQPNRPEVISLDAVRCGALSAISFSSYLEFLYCGALPSCDTLSEEVELLRLAHFFGHAPLLGALRDSLGARLGGLGEAELLEVFRAASDLKLRRLVTECLVLLLPQFGHGTAESTVAAAIEAMDATLSKAVLTQLAVQGASVLPPPAVPFAPRARLGSKDEEDARSDGSGGGGSPSGVCSTPASSRSPSPPKTAFASAAVGSHGRTWGLRREDSAASSGGCAGDGGFAAALELERMKAAFVSVLESKGWGS